LSGTLHEHVRVFGLAILMDRRNPRAMEISTSQERVVAVLGPTNTGKTYLAMDRMLAHASGMIGFPLRLLARENYDRAVKIKGAAAVALITGEEKILPRHARYFICTVESMPIDRMVDFLCIDEIQMCADPDRGHVFTDRLLHARGRHETMFLGAETMRPLLRQLVSDVSFISRPRFSTLSYVGTRKTLRLPKRSAIVAFSAADVYAIAELVRRQRGGAAVVMGALSPRTRNAQVAMYQSGEVDYIVATDAIGMGLNMDVDHVAFAATHKFDGRLRRRLDPPELAQIAGRAGRYMNDGTFGITGDAGAISEEVIGRIVNHQFEPYQKISWRNARPCFTSVKDLLDSLAVPPVLKGLVRAREADDEVVLRQMAKDPDVMEQATHYDAVRLLWDVCQVPDFGNVKSHGHARLLAQIYNHLIGTVGKLPEDWMNRQVQRLDRTDGGIDHLTQRISAIRTWTYVSFRSDWFEDPAYWREHTRAIEDRLSDALHECLTRRFVDRRTTQLMQRMRETPELLAAVKSDGDVVVEGHFVGKLSGFRFVSDVTGGTSDDVIAARAIDQAAARVLRQEFSFRVAKLESDNPSAFSLEMVSGYPTPVLHWQGAPIARLVGGSELLRPAVQVLPNDMIPAPIRKRIEDRLATWVDAYIAEILSPLIRLQQAPISGAARGLAFQIGEKLGSVSRQQALGEIAALDRTDRQTLRRLGVHIGRESIYVGALLKPVAVGLRGLLWSLYHGTRITIPPPGRVSARKAPGVTEEDCLSIGFRLMGELAVRVDMVERIALLAWSIGKQSPRFVIGPELLSLAGCRHEQMAVILGRLGYIRDVSEGTVYFRYRHARRQKKNRKTPNATGTEIRSRTSGPQLASDAVFDENSPFARLKEFRFR